MSTTLTAAVHLDPTRKHDFVLLLDVRDGNPNGDPDAGGMPRIDSETMHGLITDVAIKRKIRNTVPLLAKGRLGYDIYVEAGVALEAQQERAYREAQLSRDAKDAEAEAQRWMCQHFFDVRMFGAVMSVGALHAGRTQGPVQLTFLRSIDPIVPMENGITRVTQTRQADIDKGESTEMGSKHTVPYGLYQGYGHFSAPLAARTGVTSDDLDVFWTAVLNMLEHDRSATRGEMALRGLYVFTHDDAFGRAPAQALFDLVRVRRTSQGPARCFQDYAVEVDDQALPAGVTLTRLAG
jgi:CRISPR-associated protein Csd2